MSYEARMLEDLKMPTRTEVEVALLKSLFEHNGVIKEFGAGEEIVDEIAANFNLNEQQRNAYLKTIYRKENREKRAYLWHRLLFRAADTLAKKNLVSRPTQTVQLTSKREWMLTEDGYDKVLKVLGLVKIQKENLPVKSYEVQKVVKKLNEQSRPINYNPIDKDKKTVKITKEGKLRDRAFRQAIIEAYGYRCAVCSMKINSPDTLQWEVEAAHIVPHTSNGRDDIWNGLALCHLHHWAFDVGWFSLNDNFIILPSKRIQSLPEDFGKMHNYELMKVLTNQNLRIHLPAREEIYPHCNSMRWHRQNIFKTL